MDKGIELSLRWVGAWTGEGEMSDGTKIVLRQEFRPEGEGSGVLLNFEVFDPETMALIHGVQSIMSVAPGGVVATATFSTVFGLMSLRRTPDDEGVLALAGTTLSGYHVTVSYVEEDDGSIFFTVFWRDAENELVGGEVPSMSGKFRRVAAWKPSH